jgi:hypothetical protein
LKTRGVLTLQRIPEKKENGAKENTESRNEVKGME